MTLLETSLSLSTLLLFFGCGEVGVDADVVDADGDGIPSTIDCDDNDASLNDLDLDGDGYSTCDGDCDDGDNMVLLCPITHPGGGDMLFISAGTFDMGCTTAQQADERCRSDESPVHTVTLTHDFYMGETEVTQEEYQAVMGTNPSGFSSCGSTCPVESITWHEAAEYANAISLLDGLTECFSCVDGECSTPESPYTCDGYRLPTEAEWEYAARGGTDYLYAGSNTLDDVGWDEFNASYKTHPVAQKIPNDLGLYDMSGNVWEWVWDWFDEDYYSSSPSSNPEGPTSAHSRAKRGGSWGDGESYSRVSRRSMNRDSFLDDHIGFRLSRTVNP